MKIISINLNKEKGSCTLGVDLGLFNDLPKDVSEYALQNSFAKQNNLHVTLFGFKQGKKILDFLSTKSEKEKETFWQNLENIIKTAPIQIKETGEFFHLKKRCEFFLDSPQNKIKEDRESVIEILAVKGLEELFSSISKMGVSVDLPFPHITLFLKNDSQGHGIGVASKEDMFAMTVKKVFSFPKEISKIAIATKLQTDTVVAIFLLKKFGEKIFPSIGKASLEIMSIASSDNTNNDYESKGILLIDIGGGRFDHHTRAKKTTATKLVAEELGIHNNPAIQKLLRFVERDEFFGKGIVSEDILDKAFGFPSFVVNLNKLYQNDPQKVFDAINPIVEAHFFEENKRKVELPKLIEQKFESGQAITFSVKHRDEDLKVIYIESDDLSVSGFLRAKEGGQYDVVVVKLSSGHLNIITKNIKKIDLRSLVALIRKSEAIISKIDVGDDMEALSVSGRMETVPQWYYDPVTNSLQNGGINPQGVVATKISKQSVLEIIKIGLSELLWTPRNG